MHVCAQQGQKDEDMKGGQDKRVCGCDEKEPSAQRQTMNPTSLSNLGDLKPGLFKVQVDVHVHTKARTDVSSRTH